MWRGTVSLILVILTWPAAALSSVDADGPRREALLEYQFGHLFTDPYRWMENPDDAELRFWITQENERLRQATRGALYDQLVAEFEVIFNPPARFRSSLIQVDQLWQREHLRLRHRPSRVPEIVAPESGIDYGSSSSPNGRYQIVLESASFSDLGRLQIIDLGAASHLRLPDTLAVRYPQVFWETNDAFLYVTGLTGRPGSPQYAVYRHRLNTSQADDELVYGLDSPGAAFGLYKIEGEWFIEILTDGLNGLGRFDLATGAIDYVIPLQADFFTLTAYAGGQLYVLDFSTDVMGEVVTYDLETGVRRVMVSQSELGNRAIADFPVKVGDVFLVTVVEDAANRLLHVDTVAHTTFEVALPVEGTVFVRDYSGFIAVFLIDYTQDFALWSYDLFSRELTEVFSPAPLPLGAELVADRIFYKAHNGQRAPIWVVRAKGTVLSPETPMILYGYGGFRINILPSLRRSYIPWYLRGGAAAFVTLPGGLEYGETWHQAGSLLNKTNVFADFEAAAEHLIAAGYTRAEKLVASGGSNGGLLVGAVTNRRPDLFGAAVPEVGVMDMLRFELFTAGSFWTDEFGSRFDQASFHNLISYSPYHNIRHGPGAADYPAVLVITSDLDDRVVPGHSFKYAARLMARSRSGRPVYLLTRRWSSHSASGSLVETIESQALKWSFLLQELE